MIKTEWGHRATAMNGTYIGRLPEHDPLHGYLQHDIQPQVCGVSPGSQYRVFRLNGSNDVYLYEDRNTGTKVIGKFFLSSRQKDAEKACVRLTREFDKSNQGAQEKKGVRPDYIIYNFPELLNAVLFFNDR